MFLTKLPDSSSKADTVLSEGTVGEGGKGEVVVGVVGECGRGMGGVREGEAHELPSEETPLEEGDI